MASVCKVIILGSLGKDPEIRSGSDGSSIVTISVATSENWKDKSGEKQERTEWHRIVIFGKLAEIAGKYLQKGSSAYFEGTLRTRKWEDKSGVDRYTTEIIADKMQMLSRPQESKQGKQDAAVEEDIPF